MAKLYFYYASMNAGKSTNLLQAEFNYRERGMATMLWTAALDSRGGDRAIESRIGLHAEANRFDQTTDLSARVSAAHMVQPLSCVLVDEAQFLTKAQVWQLARIADEAGIPVLCYGLRTDFQGELFEGAAALLGIADSLVELKAVCHCGRKATMNLRVDGSGAAVRAGVQTEIGGNDRYVALCRQHFSEAMESGPMSKDDPLGLMVGLQDGDLLLEPLREDHRAALKAVCAEDADIWQMYGLSYGPEHFDASFDALLINPARLPFAILSGGDVAGMTAWIDANPRWLTAEIGNTYLSPRFRQNRVNGRMKYLMIAHGFACGLKRIQFAVDVRNERSQAACRKIGATFEGVLRNHMITWTGHLRDSAIFSIVERDRERLGY